MDIWSVIKAVVFLYLICILGFFIDSLVYYLCNKKTAGHRFNVPNLPLFFVLGGGAYAFYEMFFSILGARSNLIHFTLLFAAFSGCRGVLYLKNRVKPDSPREGGCKGNIGIVIAVILFILAPLFLNMITAMAFPQFNIDLIGHILIKAKIFITDTYRDSIFMHDDMFAGMHYRYPPFVGMFFNLLFLFGCDTIAFYQLVNYFIFLLLGIQIYYYLKDRLTAWQAFAWSFIFISTASYYRHGQHMIDSTDVLLSLAFLSAVCLLLEFDRKRDLYSLVTCSILIGITTLIKNEGVFFSIIMFFLCLRTAKKKEFSLCLFIWAIIALPWVLYAQVLPPSFPCRVDILKIGSALTDLRYVRSSLGAASGILLGDWNSVFILWFFFMTILRKGRYIKEVRVFSVVVSSSLLLSFLLVWFVFPSIGLTLGVYPNGFFRFISHVYPMALICAALTIGRLMQKI